MFVIADDRGQDKLPMQWCFFLGYRYVFVLIEIFVINVLCITPIYIHFIDPEA